MSRPAETNSRIGNAENPDLVEYRPVSRGAVVGLLLGLVSWLGLIGELLWAVPALGVAVSAVALGRIAASRGELSGRVAARIGLALSLAFLAAAISRAATESVILRRQAVGIGERWFELLAENRPRAAHQLTLSEGQRAPPGAELETFYASNAESLEAFQKFVDEQLPRTLLALGAAADVRYWGTEARASYQRGDLLRQVYAVTFEGEAQRQTFFVRLNLDREVDASSGTATWRIVAYEGGVRPFEADER